jgi:hypothetical protein
MDEGTKRRLAGALEGATREADASTQRRSSDRLGRATEQASSAPSSLPFVHHGLDDIVGYSVVLTDWSDGSPALRYEVARVDDACGYGRALDLVREVRAVCSATQYAVIDNLYENGDRSFAIDGSLDQFGLLARVPA